MAVRATKGLADLSCHLGGGCGLVVHATVSDRWGGMVLATMPGAAVAVMGGHHKGAWQHLWLGVLCASQNEASPMSSHLVSLACGLCSCLLPWSGHRPVCLLWSAAPYNQSCRRHPAFPDLLGGVLGKAMESCVLD